MLTASQRGATLLEGLLVLGIAAVIIVIGIRQYNAYLFNTNLQLLQESVEELYVAAAQYYRANCATALATTTTPYGVTPTQLISSGNASASYLPSTWTKSANNPLVAITDPTGGYLIQFNLLQQGVMKAVCQNQTCDTPSSATTPYPVLSSLSSSLPVLIWQIQISVKIKNATPALVNSIAATLGAACQTNSSTTTTALTCGTATAPYSWIAFTKLPSFAGQNSLSDYWVSTPIIKQFNLQYTHDQMYELSSQTYSNNGITGDAQGYYTCGG
jgi:Tfp pilus assembly protein PilE